MNMKLMLGASATALLLSANIAAASTLTSTKGTFSLTGPSGVSGFTTANPLPAVPVAPVTPAGQVSIQENFAGPATAGGPNIPVNTAAQDITDDDNFGLFRSSVGDFRGLGGTGSGSSVAFGGNNDQIQIRSGNNAGRFNVLGALAGEDPTGNFLDSNDTNGFSWTIKNSSILQSAWAFLTDPNDAGGRLTVSLFVDGVDQEDRVQLDGSRGDGLIWLFETNFAGLADGWKLARFDFEIMNPDGDPVNDGIGISNATINVIPLPAPALMLLSGLGALGGLSVARRRREHEGAKA